MVPASVGFQCPNCVSADRATARTPRTMFGAALSTGGGTATKIIMGVTAAVYVLDLVTRGLGSLLVMSNQAVSFGQFWRLLTYGFTGPSLLGVLLNLLVLWLVGRALESEMGGWRFIALYVAAGLGGATLCFVLGPPGLVGWGSSAAVIGLLAANAIGKFKNHEDIRGDIGLLVLLILYSVLIGFSYFGWIGMIGAALVGALVGVILAYAPRQNKTVIQLVGLLAVALACVVAVVAKIVVG
jgi:membrane associated rhomboid family serine protease